MKKRTVCLFSCCFLFFFLTASSVLAWNTQSTNDSGEETALVSPALSVLAEQNDMAISALVGQSISLEADDFARALNLSRVSKITVTETPPIADGELLCGTTVVTAGSTVSGSGLSQLCFSPRGDARTSSFRFRVEDAPYIFTCRLYLLDSVNYAPTLSAVPKSALQVSTHRNVTLFGTLPCYDPEGDDTVIEIVSYPEKGLLILTDSHSGEYTYTPSASYTGKDSFTYVARDMYGNYSASATVELEIIKPSSSVVYHDIVDAPCYNAALTMTEAGIMSGTRVGSYEYFYPEKTVSRAEFCVMAMHALGVTDLPESEAVAFADSDEIPVAMRGYVHAAYELGYVRGLYQDDALCFEPNRAITRAEAAVMLGNMLDVATPTIAPVFADADDVPAWAASSLSSLTALGILQTDCGYIDPADAVTRADAAQMLSIFMQSIEA